VVLRLRTVVDFTKSFFSNRKTHDIYQGSFESLTLSLLVKIKLSHLVSNDARFFGSL